MKQKYQAYAAATQTVARTKQIVMLYDGIIRFVQQAKEAIQENRIEDRYNMLNKASEVIMGLQACLDFENGGHIAKVLYNFYSNIDSQIFLTHRNNSVQTCEDIITEMKKMREVWQEIDQSGGETASQNPTPKQETPPTSQSDQTITLSA